MAEIFEILINKSFVPERICFRETEKKNESWYKLSEFDQITNRQFNAHFAGEAAGVWAQPLQKADSKGKKNGTILLGQNTLALL